MLIALCAAGCGTALSAVAADAPGRHPAYLHALTDLRDARWDLSHGRPDAAVAAQERQAVAEVDIAIRQTLEAAGEDGKNTNQRPTTDAHLDHPGLLHHALDQLRKAHEDLGQEEDNPRLHAKRASIEQHVDAAIGATERAISDVEQHR
jgi:hypothetical protein